MGVLHECELPVLFDPSVRFVANIDRLLRFAAPTRMTWAVGEHDNRTFKEYGLRNAHALSTHMAVHRSHVHQTFTSSHDFYRRNSERLRLLHDQRLPRPLAEAAPWCVTGVFANYWAWEMN